MAVKTYGAAAKTGITTTQGLEAGKSYIVTTAGTKDDTRDPNDGDTEAIAIRDNSTQIGGAAHAKADGTIVDGYTVAATGAVANVGDNVFKEVGTDNFVKGFTYEVVTWR